MEITPFIPYKLLLHQDRLEAMGRGELVFPISVELDLSNRCPHDCPFCSFGTSKSQGYRQQNWVTFPYPRVLSLLQELKSCGVESVTFTGGGEPLIHPQAAEILGAASANGLQWGLVTNGLLLSGEVAHQVARGATFVRVSLDAGTDATHMITHGIQKPQLTQILHNINSLRGLSASVMIGASFCVMDANYHEIETAAERLRIAGANYLEVRPTFPTDWRGDGWSNGLTPEHLDSALSTIATLRAHYRDTGFKVIGMHERFDSALLKSAPKAYSKCRIGPLTTVIGADARLWHCCVQRGQPFFELGSVSTRPFHEVWETLWKISGDRSGKIDISKCPRCRYDGYNELLEHAVHADGLHRSFV